MNELMFINDHPDRPGVTLVNLDLVWINDLNNVGEIHGLDNIIFLDHLHRAGFAIGTTDLFVAQKLAFIMAAPHSLHPTNLEDENTPNITNRDELEHEGNRDNAAGTRGTGVFTAGTGANRRITLWPARETLTPQILALLFALAVALVCFFSARQNICPISSSLDSQSSFPLSITTPASLPPVSSDSKSSSKMSATEQT